MANWIKKTVAVAAICALALPAAQIAPAQEGSTGQQNSYVFKANAELVLTNVVVRDAKTGEFVHGLKQSDFTVYENGKAAADFIVRFSNRGYGDAAERSHHQRAGGGYEWAGDKGGGCRKAGGSAQPSVDRDVFRSDVDAAGGSGSLREGCAGFSDEQDAAGRPCRAGFARRDAQGRPGLYVGQSGVGERSWRSTTGPRGRVSRRARPRIRTRWRIRRVTRPTRANTTT